MKSTLLGALLSVAIMVASSVAVMGCGGDSKAYTPGPPIVPTADQFRKKPRGKTRPVLGPVQLAGIRVLAYRRGLANGLIDVHDERVADASAHRRTLEHLKATGWTPWPPTPAPELSIGFNHLAKDSMDCGYLLNISNRPNDWLGQMTRSPQCFATLKDVEKGLAREEQIRFHISRERWCAKKTAAFPLVNVPPDKRCNVRAQLFAGELDALE